MNRVTEDHVNKQIDDLSALADHLLHKQVSSHNVLVIPFVGAGASSSAEIPASHKLQSQIYKEIIKHDNPSGIMAKLLDEEAKFHFPLDAKHGIMKLSLFQFSAVISRFAYGSKIIHRLISSSMSQATHRPLVYEHLAHLVKHEFVDHFVVLNFDELLDEALKDEIPERLRFITNPDEVPGPRYIQDAKHRCCYLFKPFGSLSNDNYKLEPDEIRRYGSESVWRFMLENIFHPRAGDTQPEIVFLLVGYAVAEPAFEQLMSELTNDSSRKINIFLIDTRADLPEILKRLKKVKNINIKHIRLPADLAFDLLVRLMESKYLSDKSNKVWIPVARHRIMSAFPYIDITTPARRFKIELIMQAIKSRGFFTIEAVAEIARIKKYSQSAYEVIQQMCNEGILTTSSESTEGNSAKYLGQDYALAVTDIPDIVAKLLETSSIKPNDTKSEWVIEKKDNIYFSSKTNISYSDFMKERFSEIARAPEIEVSLEANPSTPWLFMKPDSLTSISKLTEATADIFKSALKESTESISLYGVWTTGEWLFHEDGWAWETIGKGLIDHMERGDLEMSLVLSKNPIGKTERLSRGTTVLECLKKAKEKKACSIFQLDWWQHNRVLTLLTWKNKNGKEECHGIYMRRRLATPLVAPVKISGEDCRILQNIFDRYKAKACEI